MPVDGHSKLALGLTFPFLQFADVGSAISIAANTTTIRHRRSTGRTSSRTAASGRSSRAAIDVRASTSIDGLTSSTATLMRRYGVPQITHIAAKRSQPREVIDAFTPGG